MIGRFDGKVAVVVGASVGIGAAAARRFSDLGAAVVLASRNTQATEALADEITSRGGALTAIEVDVATDGDVESAVATALEHFGRLDIAFNNAGVQGPAAPLAEQTAEDFDRIIDVNL